MMYLYTGQNIFDLIIFCLFFLYWSCYDVFPHRLFPSLKEGLDFSLLIFYI